IVKNHEAADIFDVSSATSELAKAYADNITPPPVAPDESGAQSGADDPVSPNQGSTVRALAGANASAINAIMGRTANELIAQESAQQTKLLKQNLDESKQIKKELKELNAKKPAQNYGTCQ